MGPVGEGVDDRLVRGARELEQVRMRAQTRDDAVHVTVEDSRGVAHGLSESELHVLAGEGGDAAPEPGDPDLERDAGPVRRTLEEHGDVAALQGPLAPP